MKLHRIVLCASMGVMTHDISINVWCSGRRSKSDRKRERHYRWG